MADFSQEGRLIVNPQCPCCKEPDAIIGEKGLTANQIDGIAQRFHEGASDADCGILLQEITRLEERLTDCWIALDAIAHGTSHTSASWLARFSKNKRCRDGKHQIQNKQSDRRPCRQP